MKGAGRALSLAGFGFNPPRLADHQLLSVLRDGYGLDASLTPLDGERDQNTLATGADGRCWVLKVSGADEEPAVVDFQVQALEHIRRSDPQLPVPRLRPGVDGAFVQSVSSESGTHAVRLLSFLPGIRYQNGRFPSPRGLRGVGRFLARLGRALRDYEHPASRHFMPWAIAGGLAFDPALRALLPAAAESFLAGPLERIERTVQPALSGFRSQVIHQDAHGGNLLRPSVDGETVAGLIDFGDMIYGPLICDLAACASHFIEEGNDPVGIAAALCSGYHAEVPLRDEELEVLADLVLLRQVMTLQLFEFRRRNMTNPPSFLSGDQPGLIASLRRLTTGDRGNFVRRLKEALV